MSTQKNTLDVAIIGAGPYGLSIAAHLKRKGLRLRVFGTPMKTWSDHMPKGMRLKSEGFASSLSDPDDSFTLEQFCKERNLPYSYLGKPVHLETFCAYGNEFQRRFVPELEDKLVVSLERVPNGFRIGLEDGENVKASHVVLAVGLTYFDFMPEVFSSLPRSLASHSSDHSVLEKFRGREVIVVGAGASALDLVALLHQVGADVQLLARTQKIRFHAPPGRIPPLLKQQFRAPITGIGSGWKLVFYTRAPLMFHRLSEVLRLRLVKRTLGPAPGWFIKNDVVGKVPLLLERTIVGASEKDGRIALEVINKDGNRQIFTADHVIAATGFQVDVRRLPFLSPSLRDEIKTVEHSPILSSNFESSAPRLYFVGTASANSFGPLMRFAFGARFTARRLAKHLARFATNKVSALSADRTETLRVSSAGEPNESDTLAKA
jgi:hypothetical protein